MLRESNNEDRARLRLPHHHGCRILRCQWTDPSSLPPQSLELTSGYGFVGDRLWGSLVQLVNRILAGCRGSRQSSVPTTMAAALELSMAAKEIVCGPEANGEARFRTIT